MSDHDQNELIKALTLLTGLKNNLPNENNIHQKYVHAFHQELDRLNRLGFKLEEFKIPASELKPIVEGGNYVTGEMSYSTDKYTDKSLFLMKLDAILSFFKILNSDIKIGFALN